MIATCVNKGRVSVWLLTMLLATTTARTASASPTGVTTTSIAYAAGGDNVQTTRGFVDPSFIDPLPQQALAAATGSNGTAITSGIAALATFTGKASASSPFGTPQPGTIETTSIASATWNDRWTISIINPEIASVGGKLEAFHATTFQANGYQYSDPGRDHNAAFWKASITLGSVIQEVSARQYFNGASASYNGDDPGPHSAVFDVAFNTPFEFALSTSVAASSEDFGTAALSDAQFTFEWQGIRLRDASGKLLTPGRDFVIASELNESLRTAHYDIIQWAQSVPEPSSAGMFALVLVILMRRK